MSLAPDTVRGVAAPNTGLLSGNLLCAASMFTWAAGYPAAEMLLERWDTLALINARFMLAVFMLIPVWIIVEGPRAVFTAQWRRGAIIGGIGFGLGAWLLLIAQALTDPVTVAIIASAAPVVATVIEVLRDGRRLTGGFVLGLIASIVGGLIVIGGTVGGTNMMLGVLVVVTSSFFFIWGSRAAVKDLPDQTNLGRTTLLLSGGLMATAVIFLCARALGLAALPQGGLLPDEVAPLMVYALASMALSQLLWIASVGRLGVALASFHMNSAPFYAMLIMLALGSGWSWRHAAGAAVVVLGVALAQRPARR